MAKKKRTGREKIGEMSDLMAISLKEDEPLDDEEEGEESEREDLFAEDEDDIAMARNLETEDDRIALSMFLYEEEVGFNPMFDWSSLSEADHGKYAAIMSLSEEKLEKLSWKRMTPFQKWIVARAYSRYGQHETFREIALSIIRARKQPEELCVKEIHLELIWDYAETKQHDEALDLLEKFEQAFADEQAAAMRVRGLLLIDRGELDKGKEVLDHLFQRPFNKGLQGFEHDKTARDDKHAGVVQYEVGHALMSMRHFDLALAYFERAKNLASLNDNFELTTAIENARALAVREMNRDT
ncbi:MAG: hypothetical protein FWC40_08475 [Proteobacteria bacterium]|nr:hypothetical protein [Pseudomonadota bacterium]